MSIIPIYLHTSGLYQNFNLNFKDFELDDFFTSYKPLYCKKDTNIFNQEDFIELVETINFWNGNVFQPELYIYIYHHYCEIELLKDSI